MSFLGVKGNAIRKSLACLLSLLLILSLVVPTVVMADNGDDEPITINLRATGLDGDVFNVGDFEVPAGEITIDGHTLDRHTAMGAVAEYVYGEGINFEITEGDWGLYVFQIGDDADDENSWMYYVNGSSPWDGASVYELEDGDALHFGNFNLNLYEPVSIDIRATGLDGDVFNDVNFEVPYGEIDISVNGEIRTLNQHTAMGALAYYCQESQIDIEIKEGQYGLYINQIGDDGADENSWMYYVNGSSPWESASEYEPGDGDALHFVNYNLGLYSLSQKVDKDEIEAGDEITVTVTYTDGDGSTAPVAGADIFVSDETDDWGSPLAGDPVGETDSSGELSFTWNQTGEFYPYAEWNGKTSQSQWPVASFTVGKKSVELDPLDSEWVKNDHTVLDALLKFQQDDGSFWWQEDTAGQVKMSTTPSLAALVDLAYGKSTKHRTGQSPDFDPEHETLAGAVEKAVQWYQANHPAPENWEGLPALQAAGEDLNGAPWQSTQNWRNADPGFETDATGNEHIHHILRLLAVGLDPANIWGDRNLFEELAAQQQNGSFGDLGRQIWAIVALDVGRELTKNVGNWETAANRQSAVNHLLNQQNSDGSFGAFSQLDYTGWALVALSNYMGDQDVVDAAINDALSFLQGRQQNNGGFSMPGEWGAENASTNAAVISGLVAVGEDLAIGESAIPVDETPLSITIPQGAASSRLNASTTTEGDKETATLPSIEVEATTSLGNARLEIPQGTKVSGPSNWTGSIKLPELLDNSSVNVSGGNVSAVLEVGFPEGQLDFDKPVRLLIPGQAGKAVGYTRDGASVTEITKTLNDDSQAAASAELSGDAGKIDVGGDLAIWTTHFTKFVAYTPDTPSKSPSPGGGGLSPSPTTEQVTLSVEAGTIGKGNIISSTRVDLEEGDTAYSVLKREVDARGISFSGSANYVSGIDGLNEFDHGPLSGWKYEVNGDFPTVGPGDYSLSDGDRLRWRYSTDGGEDLGMELDGTEKKEQEEKDDEEFEEIKAKLYETGDKAADWLLAQLDYAEHDNHLDWSVFALARSGVALPDEYRELLLEYVTNNEGAFRLVTDYARIALAAAAVGLNPADLAGYNLVEKIYSSEKMTKQGTNGPVFALIALDALDYQVPNDAPWTRERLVGWILEQQNRDGGFSLHKKGTGSSSEVDVTAMVLQALANYREREVVEEAVESALDWLSEQQLPNGGFKTLGEENCESVAQVIIALTALEIDPMDARFVKEDGSLLSNLLSFAADDGGVSHARGEGSSTIATQQALMAIDAYQRLLDGEPHLFAMKGIELETVEEEEKEKDKEKEKPYFRDDEDISPWAAVAVRKAWEYGLMKGVSETEPQFAPKQELTRAEITTLLVRMYEIEPLQQSKVHFGDVNPEDWHFGHVMAAKQEGLVSGVSADEFLPNLSVSREEIAVMLNRKLGLEDDSYDAVSIKDLDQTANWAEPAVKALFSNGVMVGDNGHFRPKDPVTREMAAVIIVRIYERYLQ